MHRICFTVGVLFLVAAAWAATAAESERPNFLLLMADNWAWPHAGACGDPSGAVDE
jgi:hypothetical protein